MEHSAAIMQDAGKTVDEAASQSSSAAPPAQSEQASGDSTHKPNAYNDDRQANESNRRKRKNDFPDARQQFGSRGRGGGRGRNDGKRHQKGGMGRGQYFRDEPDKRAKTEQSRQKRELDGNAKTYGTTFSKEEIDAEERRPKKKVAVLIGYSGTGYKGMQITPHERTIEGDLFQAFVKAGAISKANADDPKKASLVRCARTDKGVHAAGNMISLKLIVEDEDIVDKINAELSPQIRVWGIERTIGSFSCYQACDSRWYEYLIPSHAFLPPHPSSWLAKKMEELADEAGDREGYESRQAEVKGFWEKVDEGEIKSILEDIDEDIRWDVVKALQGEDEASAKAVKSDADVKEEVGAKAVKSEELPHGDEEQPVVKAGTSVGVAGDGVVGDAEKTEEAAIIIQAPAVAPQEPTANPADPELQATEPNIPEPTQAVADTTVDPDADRQARLRAATKRLRNAYITAKRRYRIPKERIDRIQDALTRFVGTNNYHNFTIQKTYKDPSSKRHIKSFVVNPQPILIGEGAEDSDKSEWLSMKVHGQSFMMHQIRKMIGMVTLLVRCGSDLSTLNHSLQEEKYSIPKVPGLGLLLERPVFDSYNNLQAAKYEREALRFDKYEKELEAFKQREIYQRIFREEEERNEFGRFFSHVDNFKEGYFLYVTSKGLEATKGYARGGGKSLADVEGSDGEGEGDGNDQ